MQQNPGFRPGFRPQFRGPAPPRQRGPRPQGRNVKILTPMLAGGLYENYRP